MKKLIVLLGATFFWCTTNAQNTVVDTMKDGIQIALDSFFKFVDTSQVTTHLLFEKTLHESRMGSLQGHDNTVAMRDWFAAYNELYYMKTGQALFKTADDIMQNAMSAYSKRRDPIIILNYNYNYLDTNAFHDSLFHIINYMLPTTLTVYVHLI